MFGLPKNPSDEGDAQTLSVDPWQQSIERRGTKHTLVVHVESRFSEWDRAFALTKHDAVALVADPARRTALHRVLHPLLQVERAKPLPDGLADRLIRRAASAPLDGLEARLRALTPDGQAEREANRLLQKLEPIARTVEALARMAELLRITDPPAPPVPPPGRSRRPIGEEIRLDLAFERYEPLLKDIGAEHEIVLRDPRGPGGKVTREYRWRGRLIHIEHAAGDRFAAKVTFGIITTDPPPGPYGWIPLEALTDTEARQASPDTRGAQPEWTDGAVLARRIAALGQIDPSRHPAFAVG